jgi:hypothetical protein
VRRKRPEMLKDSWILHHDNMPAYNTLSVKTFLAKHKIPVLEHPHYSSDLAPCDFFISKDEVCIKRNPFRVHRCRKGKGDGGNEEAIRKGPAAFGKFAWDYVWIGEWTTLKVIIFPLCD